MQMEEAKEIVEIASEFLSETIPTPRGNVRLEQIEEKPADWLVVLSYLDPASASPLLQSLSTSRVYKELVINARSKEVKALRVWKA